MKYLSLTFKFLGYFSVVNGFLVLVLFIFLLNVHPWFVLIFGLSIFGVLTSLISIIGIKNGKYDNTIPIIGFILNFLPIFIALIFYFI